jgi:hypothetical protein
VVVDVFARVVGVDELEVTASYGPPGMIESVISPAFTFAAAVVSDSAPDCAFVQARAAHSAASGTQQTRWRGRRLTVEFV